MYFWRAILIAIFTKMSRKSILIQKKSFIKKTCFSACMFLFLVIITKSNLFAQNIDNYNNNWVFGQSNRMNFTGGGPTVTSVTSTIDGAEGVASISDGFGNLLFYANVNTTFAVNRNLYGANHLPMPNGSNLMSHESASQGIIITLDPENCDQYYVFYVSNTAGYNLRYSKVDMTLNGGFGDVIPGQKDVLLFTTQSEQVTIARKGFSKYFWVVTRQSVAGTPSDSFVAIDLLPGGTFGAPVISGFSVPPATMGGAGYIAFNNNDTECFTVNFAGNQINKYAFDNLTGAFSNKINVVNDINKKPYGACYNVDNKQVFVTYYDQVTGFDMVRIYDLLADPNGGVFYNYNLGSSNSAFFSCQLAPNGKVYINNDSNSSLHVVNDPNDPLVPNITSAGQALPGQNFAGLNNMYDPYTNMRSYADLMSGSQTICYNTSAVIGGIADSLQAVYSWAGQIMTPGGWSTPSASYLVNPNVTNPTTINLTSTTRFLLTLLTDCGDTIMTNKEFVYLDSLSTPVVTGVLSYCAGETITALTSTPAIAPSGVINWYSNLGLTTLVGTGTSFMPANTPGSTTYYVVEQENGSMNPLVCTSTITTVTVTISPGIALCYTKRAAKWYMGNTVAINFLCASPPTPLDDCASTTAGNMENNVSISDNNGNLLFYAFNNVVMNRNHVIMPNGTGLQTDYSASQGFLPVPHPTNPDRYYLFTIGNNGSPGLHYSEIDLLADGGLGDVIPGSKNTFLLAGVPEHLTAVESCIAGETWVIVHDANNMYSFRINASGISAPVISPSPISLASSPGQLKASPTGRHIALSVQNSPSFLFTFDNETGKVCYKETLTHGGYGCSFSNNGQYFYANDMFQGIWQYNAYASNVDASGTMVYDPWVGGAFLYGGMHLGPDCKLYVFGQGQSTGTVINNPNLGGIACDIQPELFPLSNGSPSYSNHYASANYIQSWFKDPTYVEPIIAANFTYVTACLPSPTTFTNTSTTIGECPPYLWDFGDAASGASNTSTLTNPSHIFSSPGTYNVTLTLTERCQTSVKTQTLTVYGVPTALIAADSTVCENFGVTLNTTAVGDYLWTGPSGNMSGVFTSTLQNPTNPISLGDGFANEGWYYLTVTNAGGCSATDSIYITILAVPSPSIASSISNCVQTLTGSVGASNGPIVTYAWGPGGGNSLGTTSVINLPPGYPGPQVVFIVTDTEGCGAGAIMLAGPLVPPVAPTALVTIQPTCTTPTGTIVVAAPLGATIQYSNGGAYQVGTTFSGLAPGNYNITAQNMTTGCISTVTVLTVNAIPTAPIATIIADTTVCDQNLVTLSTPSIGTYLWTGPGFGGGFSSTLQNPTNPLHLGLNFFNEGWYYLTVTNAAGCSSTDSVYITILAPPDPFYIDSIANCQDIFTVGVFSSNGPIVSYVWGPIALGTDSVVTVPFGYSGPINCILTDSEGCGQGIIWSTTAPVTPTAPIIGTITQPTCTTPTGTIVVAAPIGATIQYSNGGAYQVGTTFSGLAPGNYNITAQDMTTGCISTVTVLTVNAVGAGPTVTVSPDVIINLGTSTTLNAFGANSYMWIPTTGLDVSTGATVIASPNTTTIYCVIGQDLNGCTDTACAVVTISIDCGNLFVPNVFSPNENSLDDELCLFGADCIQGLSFKIYNRWGELIYESTDPKECWNGTYKEKIVSTGVYAYTLEATSAANEPISKKGTITVVK